jgi:hypothetical protein
MGKHTLRMRGLVVALTLTMFGPPALAQTIPSDAKNPSNLTCIPSQTLFNSWFISGTAAANGVVLPANSVTFPNQPNCTFYEWSQQMFLWLTSPVPATYGGGGNRVLFSPVFYTISPATNPPVTGPRTFIAHGANLIPILNVRAAQVGANGLPVIFDTQGHLLQIAPTPVAADGNQLIRNSAGALVEIKSTTLTADRQPVFLDTTGKQIAIRRAVQPHALLPAPRIVTPEGLILNRITPASTLIVQRFIINGHPIFIDGAGNVVETEPGQADDGVLESQGGSLVYYITMANDVYAYLATGLAHNAFSLNGNFPTTAPDLAKITTYASAHGKTFPDPNALAVEVKSSWVEANTVPNPGSYITMNATIPTYDKSNPSLWKPNGMQTVSLALVGIHVVGSTAGHPEMVWASFEHFGNSPNGAYSYNSTSGLKTVTPSAAGTWLFASSGAPPAPINEPVMTNPFQTTNIAVIPPATFGPVNIVRVKAFGAATNLSPNPFDNNAATSNTEIIEIDHAILSMLPSADVRSNYFMLGATWTENGASPSPVGDVGGNQVGTNVLSNTTMETFQQGKDATTTNGASNCFSCHFTNTTAVSHVFGAMQPLF